MEGFAITVFLKLRSPQCCTAACGSLPIHKYFITPDIAGPALLNPGSRLLSASFSLSLHLLRLFACLASSTSKPGGVAFPPWFSEPGLRILGLAFLPQGLRPPSHHGIGQLGPCSRLAFSLRAPWASGPALSCPSSGVCPVRSPPALPGSKKRDPPAPSPAAPDMLRCWSPGQWAGRGGGGWSWFSSE